MSETPLLLWYRFVTHRKVLRRTISSLFTIFLTQEQYSIFGLTSVRYTVNLTSSLLMRRLCRSVMRIIKLNLFPVPVRVHSGYGKLIFVITSLFSKYLSTLYIGWSLVRRRVTRRLTRLQTMHNVLNIAKKFKTVAVPLRLIFQFTYVLYCKGKVRER